MKVLTRFSGLICLVAGSTIITIIVDPLYALGWLLSLLGMALLSRNN